MLNRFAGARPREERAIFGHRVWQVPPEIVRIAKLTRIHAATAAPEPVHEGVAHQRRAVVYSEPAFRNDRRKYVVTNDFLLLGGDNIFTPVIPEGGFAIDNGTPLVRDTLVDWFRRRGGSMNASEFRDPNNLRWNLPDPVPENCSFFSGSSASDSSAVSVNASDRRASLSVFNRI